MPDTSHDPTDSLYADPHIYDILHSPETASDYQGLRRIAREFTRGASNRQTWLEPACGSARYLRKAAGDGVRVMGFDIDGRMLDYARARLADLGIEAEARLVMASMEDFLGDGPARIPPASCDFAFNLINTFRHLGSEKAALAHLDQMRRALRPGGVYAVGLSRSAYGLEPPTEDIWEADRDGVGVRQIVSYIPPTRGARIERVISHLIITRPGMPDEHRDDTYALRSYNTKQWLALLERAGWKILGSRDEAGDPIEPVEPGYSIDVLSPG